MRYYYYLHHAHFKRGIEAQRDQVVGLGFEPRQSHKTCKIKVERSETKNELDF